MHAILVTTHPEKISSELFLKTMQSIQAHGFTSFAIKPPEPLPHSKDVELYLYEGETIQTATQGKKSTLLLGQIHIEVERGTKSFAIVVGKNTPRSPFIQLLQSNSTESKQQLLREYPGCLEAHMKYAMDYMTRKAYKNAFAHFQIAQALKHKPDKSKGYIPAWHNYRCDFESSMCAYYAGEHEIGHIYNDRMLVNRCMPSSILTQAYRNYEFFIQPLAAVWTKDYVVDDMDEIPESVQGWKSLNPSLLPKRGPEGKEEFYLNIRIVNWSVNPIGFNRYSSPHPKGKFKTRNLLAVLSSEGEYVQPPRLIQKQYLEIKKVRKDHIDGFEDCKLFAEDEDQTLHFSTNYTKNNPKGRMRLSLGTISFEDGDPQYTSLTPIVGHNEHLTQKNWLLFGYKKGMVRAVYDYDPYTLVEIDVQTGNATALSQTQLPIRSGEFRGSAGPIPFEEGYLIVIHQVYFKEHGGRRYIHRFIKVDKDHIPIEMSVAWYLQSKDIEYVSTMCRLAGDKILIGYGMCDKCACVSCISIESILRMLRPIDKYL